MRLLVGDVFRRAARATPNRPAASLDGQVLTFGDVERVGDGLAAGLRDRGIAHGDRVVFWADTSLDAVPLFAALAHLGAVFVPLNPRLSDAEAGPILAKARPHAVVGDAERVGTAARLVPDVPVIPLDDLLDAPATGFDEPPLAGDDPHVIFFTSGSTGAPKGVVLSHRANVLRTYPGNTAPPAGGTVCMFPLFHMASWTLALGCWQSLQEIVFVPVADAAPLLEAVERRRARRIYLIPAVWRRVLGADRAGHDLSSLREADTGTSATPPELLAAIHEALPHTVTRVMYGSTEAGPGTSLAAEDLSRKPGSVGLPNPGVEVRIGAGGEVEMRSSFLMSGYFEDPEATASALVDGWYRTGDLGTLDDEGYLSIVGRARDVIRSGGETVAPPEVETVLAAHPAVAEVAVVGIPDTEWGEVVCAVIVPRDAAPDLADLRRHCEGRLASFKHPRRLEVVDALPRTPATGQIQRTLLVERLTART